MKTVKYEEKFSYDEKDGPKKTPKKGCLYYFIFGIPLWVVIIWVIYEMIVFNRSL